MSILRDFIQIGESIYWSEWNVLTIEVGIEQNGLLFLFKSNNWSKFLTNGLHWVLNEGSLTNVVQP